MTNVSATSVPTIVRRLGLARLSFPRLAIGASLSAISGSWCGALKLLYVAPYASLGRQQQIVPDDDLKGRDPNW